MPANVLMFSIAQNGYGSIYRKCIQSHRQYAKKHGYKYILFDRPNWVSSAPESAWLRIPIILEGLQNQYDWIFYIDADCEVRHHTPAIQTIEKPNKSIYVVHGHSGRVNSGVMIVKNAPEARQFFETVLAAAETTVPEEDQAPYENGHIIHYVKQCSSVHVLDLVWNNTYNASLEDYVRHYTGPMRQYYRRSWFDQLLYKSVKFQSKIFRRLAVLTSTYAQEQKSLKQKLESLIAYCRNEFPLARS